MRRGGQGHMMRISELWREEDAAWCALRGVQQNLSSGKTSVLAFLIEAPASAEGCREDGRGVAS